MTVRTPGRRPWEVKYAIRLGGFISICMLAISIWFLYGRVRMLETPYNPHYKVDSCIVCHQTTDNHTNSEDCFRCHDVRTRELNNAGLISYNLNRKNGTECYHPIKQVGPKTDRTVTALCISCHKKVQGYVAMIDIATKKYVEVDMAVTHPIGLMPTETIYPRTLPLSKETGAINCITCHDQHASDHRLRMLRYYYPGNGHPADFRPLCLDCHPDGWLPLKLRPSAVRETARREN